MNNLDRLEKLETAVDSINDNSNKDEYIYVVLPK